MSRAIKAIYDNGKVEFIEEAPKGKFKVVVNFPDKVEEEVAKMNDLTPVAFGIWRERGETKDSVLWVQSLRKKWTFRKT